MTLVFLFKLTLVLLLLFVIFNLGRALYSMVKYDREDPNSVPMSRFLGKRLFISVIVIMVLLIGLTSGLISPNDRPY
ncbi:DUF2909 domain-containing protein [Vibrio algivorus]|uniref:DUF2909 domain-containing protein n=1 Tax=Vibrio algivorus TaxID=1667024 RepID=A0A557P4Z7_9VIBR|nr:DUF2909 domain-containing protein [Vibrio algivorus]TVO35718.1 DUF2909 domain-containing protein [Vibrio algivorus]GLT13457.1 hypothetical protein GCM10007931_04310 [Vibrio algivorus]